MGSRGARRGDEERARVPGGSGVLLTAAGRRWMASVWPPAATDDARPSNGAREQEVGDKGVSGLDVYCSNGLQCTVQL